MNDFEKLFDGKDELLKQVKDVIGEAKIIIDDGKLIPKFRFDEVIAKRDEYKKEIDSFVADKDRAVNEAVTEYKEQIEGMASKLKTLEGLDGVTEDLKTKLQEAQTQATEKVADLTAIQEKAKDDYEKQITEQKKTHRIETELLKVNVKNLKAVAALLDFDTISLDGDNLVGFDDQKNKLLASDPYLFGQVRVDGPNAGKGDGDNSDGEFTMDDVDNWNDATIQKRMPEILEKMKTN